MERLLGINKIAQLQHDWVERMGWHNKNDLESMALIASEVGEAAAECLGAHWPSDEFGMELADIILRVADLAQVHGFDLEERYVSVVYGTGINEIKAILVGLTPLASMAYMMTKVAMATNCCRRGETTGNLDVHLAEIVFMVIEIAQKSAVDILDCVERKMEINEARGTRGRAV